MNEHRAWDNIAKLRSLVSRYYEGPVSTADAFMRILKYYENSVSAEKLVKSLQDRAQRKNTSFFKLLENLSNFFRHMQTILHSRYKNSGRLRDIKLYITGFEQLQPAIRRDHVLPRAMGNSIYGVCKSMLFLTLTGTPRKGARSDIKISRPRAGKFKRTITERYTPSIGTIVGTLGYAETQEFLGRSRFGPALKNGVHPLMRSFRGLKYGPLFLFARYFCDPTSPFRTDEQLRSLIKTFEAIRDTTLTPLRLYRTALPIQHLYKRVDVGLSFLKKQLPLERDISKPGGLAVSGLDRRTIFELLRHLDTTLVALGFLYYLKDQPKDDWQVSFSKKKPKAGRFKRTITEAVVWRVLTERGMTPTGRLFGPVLAKVYKRLFNRGADDFANNLMWAWEEVSQNTPMWAWRELSQNSPDSPDSSFNSAFAFLQDVIKLGVHLHKIVYNRGSTRIGPFIFVPEDVRKIRDLMKPLSSMHAIFIDLIEDGFLPGNSRGLSLGNCKQYTRDLLDLIDVLLKKKPTPAKTPKISRSKIGKFKRTITENSIVLTELSHTSYTNQLELKQFLYQNYNGPRSIFNFFVSLLFGYTDGWSRSQLEDVLRNRAESEGNSLATYLEELKRLFKAVTPHFKTKHPRASKVRTLERSLKTFDDLEVSVRTEDLPNDVYLQLYKICKEMLMVIQQGNDQLKVGPSKKPKAGRFRRTITETFDGREAEIIYKVKQETTIEEALRAFKRSSYGKAFREYLKLVDQAISKKSPSVIFKAYFEGLSAPLKEMSFRRFLNRVDDLLKHISIHLTPYMSHPYVRTLCDQVSNSTQDFRKSLPFSKNQTFSFMHLMVIRMTHNARDLGTLLLLIERLGKGSTVRASRPKKPKVGKFKRTITESVVPKGLRKVFLGMPYYILLYCSKAYFKGAQWVRKGILSDLDRVVNDSQRAVTTDLSNLLSGFHYIDYAMSGRTGKWSSVSAQLKKLSRMYAILDDIDKLGKMPPVHPSLAEIDEFSEGFLALLIMVNELYGPRPRPKYTFEKGKPKKPKVGKFKRTIYEAC